MTKQQLLETITKLKVWKQRGQRAPHKPLLLLLALSRIQHNKERLVLFSDIEKDLTEKLIEFGPQRKSYYPEEPFCRLRTDGLWELTAKRGFQIPATGSIQKTILRKEQVKGGLTLDTYNLLKSDQELIEKVASILLKANFPNTIHQDILDAMGLDIEVSQQANANTQKKKRDPKFRGRILQAYNYRCAICGFDVRLGNTPIALEAAHIMWHQAGGPDTENNGLALCSLHHKLLDRGAQYRSLIAT